MGPLWSLLLWERLHLPWDRIHSDRLFHWIDSFLLLLSQKLVVNHFDKVRVRVYNYDDESQSHLNGTFRLVVVEVGTSQGGSHREDPCLWMRATLLTLMPTSKLTIGVLTLHWRAVLLIIYPWICKCIILLFVFFQRRKKKNLTQSFSIHYYSLYNGRRWQKFGLSGHLGEIMGWLQRYAVHRKSGSLWCLSCHFRLGAPVVWQSFAQ